MHLNISSLLPKTDQLRNLVKRTKAALIVISESNPIALSLIQQFTWKIKKFFVSLEIGTKEVLLVTIEVTLTEIKFFSAK